jgi:hypothetical protein
MSKSQHEAGRFCHTSPGGPTAWIADPPGDVNDLRDDRVCMYDKAPSLDNHHDARSRSYTP